MAPKKEKINKKNKDGLTPLHIAAEKGNLKRLQQLLKNEKTEVNCENDSGDTPLYTAVFYEKLDIIQELLKHPEINVNHQSKDGDTPLKCAIYRIDRKDYDIIKELLKHPKIELNNQEKDDNTILYDLIQNNNFEVAKLLFENGANLKSDFSFVREKINNIKKNITIQETRIKDFNLKIEKDKRILNEREIGRQRQETTELAKREEREKELKETIKIKIQNLTSEFFHEYLDKKELQNLNKEKDITKKIEKLEIKDKSLRPLNRYQFNQIQENEEISEIKKINDEFNKLKDKRILNEREIGRQRQETTELAKREEKTKELIKEIKTKIAELKKQLNTLQTEEKKLIKFEKKVKGLKYDFNKYTINSIDFVNQPSTSGYNNPSTSKSSKM